MSEPIHSAGRDHWPIDRLLGSGVPINGRTINIVFSLWVVAFLLKHAGASWDLAWHYRFVRDDLIPPHIVNLLGNGLALVLLAIQIRYSIAIETRGLIILFAGFALFIVALPLDLLNHRVFGLDVTIWSIPHLLFFAGSTIALVGVLHMWHVLAPAQHWRAIYTYVFLTLLVDCALFVLGQFEYGVLSIDAYLKGHATASAALLLLAHGDVARFATGGVPAWVYPIWMVLTITGTLLGARAVHQTPWTATIVMICYLSYRAIGHVLLTAASFPPSFIPIMLLGVALVIDLAARWHWRPIVASLAILLVFYGGAAIINQLIVMPACDPSTALLIALPLWGLQVMSQRPS